MYKRQGLSILVTVDIAGFETLKYAPDEISSNDIFIWSKEKEIALKNLFPIPANEFTSSESVLNDGEATESLVKVVAAIKTPLV